MTEIVDKNNHKSMKSMFNNIADKYDFMNNIISFYSHKIIKKDAVNKLFTDKPKSISDVCTGTGDIALLLNKKYPDAKITAIDFSKNMLNIAKTKCKSGNIKFLEADFMEIPFEENSFDICTIAFGLRNLPDIQKALQIFNKILKPNGELLIIDLVKPKWPYSLILNKAIPNLAQIFYRDKAPYQYLVDSTLSYPSPNEICQLLNTFNYSNIKNYNYLFGTISVQKAQKALK